MNEKNGKMRGKENQQIKGKTGAEVGKKKKMIR